MHEAKLNRDTFSLNESGIEPHHHHTTLKNTSDQSILIDPRQSVAYKQRDENLQVVDSEYTKHLDCGTPTKTSFALPKATSNTTDSYSQCSSSLMRLTKSVNELGLSPNDKQNLKPHSDKYRSQSTSKYF